MFKLLLKMLFLPPGLVKLHAQGYVDLLSLAGARYMCTLKNRWLMFALGAMTFFLALIFGGMAVLLWGAFPMDNAPQVWVLWALPASLLVLSLVCWMWAKSLKFQPFVNDIQQQIQLDILAIREANRA
ncbi:MAG: hypothetical protein RIT44_197 [Pseudomonadota bacterium]|jgi:hypothetical protein